MRTYPQDSSQAVARVLTLAMMSDGKLLPEELEVLTRRKAFSRVGISEGEFIAVMQEFCDDMLAGTEPGSEDCVIDRQQVQSLLDAVNDPAKRKAVCELMLHIIRADGRLHPGESMIFWEALDRWALSLNELTKPTRSTSATETGSVPAKRRTRRRRLYRRLRSDN